MKFLLLMTKKMRFRQKIHLIRFFIFLDVGSIRKIGPSILRRPPKIHSDFMSIKTAKIVPKYVKSQNQVLEKECKSFLSQRKR